MISNRNPGPAPIWDDALNPAHDAPSNGDSGKLLRSPASASPSPKSFPDDGHVESEPPSPPRIDSQPGGRMRGWKLAGALTGVLLGASTAALLFPPPSESSLADPALILVAAEEAEASGDTPDARTHYESLLTRHPGSPEAAIARRALRRIR